MKLIYLSLILLLIPIAYSQECLGCLYEDNCVDLGTQKIINENTFYCGEIGLKTVKTHGFACENNYECLSFFCDQNICGDLDYGREFEEYSQSFSSSLNNFASQLTTYILPVILILLGGGLVIYILMQAFRYKGRTKRKKSRKRRYTLKPHKHSGKKYEKLEKDIDKSFEDVEEALK